MEQYENYLDNLQKGILMLFVKLGAFAISFMPALFLGMAVFASSGWLAAIVVAVALEIASIVLVYLSVETYGFWRKRIADKRKLITMLTMTPLNALLISVTVGLGTIQALAVISPFVVLMVYTAVSISLDNHHLEDERKKAKTERVEASTKPAQCQLCSREFGTQAALNAHKRFCKGG